MVNLFASEVLLPSGDIARSVNVDLVATIFDGIRRENIRKLLPLILSELSAVQLGDRIMIALVLAILNEITPSFAPSEEQVSLANTTPGGAAYDRYEGRADLGNTQPDDGARYRGRGLWPIVGRMSYQLCSEQCEVDLINNPELANKPDIAAKILATSFKRNESQLRKRLAANDFNSIRRMFDGRMEALDKVPTTLQNVLSVLPGMRRKPTTIRYAAVQTDQLAVRTRDLEELAERRGELGARSELQISATGLRALSPSSSEVDVSAFGPAAIARSGEALIQIYLHRPEQSAAAAQRARESDSSISAAVPARRGPTGFRITESTGSE